MTDVLAVVGTLPAPAQIVTVPALAATTPVELVNGGCVLLGWSIAAGATASRVTFYDGPVGNGVVAGVVELAAAGSSTEGMPVVGVLCQVSLWVEATKATLKGAAYVSPLRQR